jgi:NADPH:quinone reductase-like Zn-dependent oxidoreductase
MKAIVYRRFGSPDVLELAEVERLAAGEGQVLVRIRAVGLNPYDWHFMRGEPLLFRPMMGVGVRKPRRPTVLGSDIAGVVEAVGEGVTRFRPGDEVYGTKGPGACAEPITSSTTPGRTSRGATRGKTWSSTPSGTARRAPCGELSRPRGRSSSWAAVAAGCSAPSGR